MELWELLKMMRMERRKGEKKENVKIEYFVHQKVEKKL